MNLLVIDCSANLCAACVFDTDTDTGVERGRAVEDIGKGHAERLMAVVADAMRQADVAFAGLGAIVVSVGPGSFTGIRVAVSAARGFALALKIPSIGVSVLEALAAEARAELGKQNVLAVLTSGPDHVQAAGYDALGRVWHDPEIMTIGQAAELAQRSDTALAGTAARSVAGVLPDWNPAIAAERAAADIVTYARLGAARGFGGEKPRPLYLREPDAKPQAGFILPRAIEPGAGR